MWEYRDRVLTFENGLWKTGGEYFTDVLNRLGKEGWEVVETLPDPEDAHTKYLLLKRQIKEQGGQSDI